MAGVLNQSVAGLLTAPIAHAPWNDRIARVWGSGLTPQTITGVYRNADQGYLWLLADLLEELRGADTHLQSVLAKRELQVASSAWEIRPPAGTGKRAQGIADYCRDRLLEIEAQDDLGRAFPDAVADLMGAVYHGRAVLEAVWRQDGRWWYPEQLEFVHPRRCAYATDWRLHLWDAGGTASQLGPCAPWDAGARSPTKGAASPFGSFPGIPLEAFPAGKFIAHRPRVRGTYPTREGLGRVLAWYACFKRFGWRDWLAYVEWAGRGMRIGTFAAGGNPDNPARAQPQAQEELKAVIDNLSSSVSAVIPDTETIEVRDAPNTNDVHDQLVTACNLEMSKCVLGETLTTEVGSTGGNRALGEVQDTIRLMIATGDARALASTLRRDLLRPMVRRTFGPQAPVPTLEFAVAPKEDLDALARRVALLVKDAGLTVGQRWLREALGAPEPTAGEAVLGAPPKTPGGDPPIGSQDARGASGDD